MTGTTEFVLAQTCCVHGDCAQSVQVGVQGDSANDKAFPKSNARFAAVACEHDARCSRQGRYIATQFTDN